MSTYRYCGELKIRITYIKERMSGYKGMYRCVISYPGCPKKEFYITHVDNHAKAPACSPEAYQSAAKQVVATADEFMWPGSKRQSWIGGYYITTKPQ